MAAAQAPVRVTKATISLAQSGVTFYVYSSTPSSEQSRTVVPGAKSRLSEATARCIVNLRIPRAGKPPNTRFLVFSDVIRRNLRNWNENSRKFRRFRCFPLSPAQLPQHCKRIRPPIKRTPPTISTMPSSTGTILLYFLTIWLPFLPVAMRRGCSADLLINILLCCLGWIPGIIHAWYIISKTEKHPASIEDPTDGGTKRAV